MAILSKIIWFIYLFPMLLYASTYIQSVDVSAVDDYLLSKELIRRFQGTVVETRQIRRYVNRIYLRGIYETVDYDIKKQGLNYTLVFNVRQNPTVRHVVFNNSDINAAYIKQNMKTKIGQPYNFNFVSDDVDFINNYLILKGYFLESVRDIKITDKGVLYIQIETPRLHDIRLAGLERTKSFVLYRDLIARKGDRINTRLLNIDADTLNSLPYFSAVSAPMIDFISSENVSITYQFRERKINRFDFGLEELENDQGVALFTKFKLYHAFLYSDFLLFQTQLGYLNQLNIRTYKVHYQQPWLFNRYQFITDMMIYTSYRSEIYQGESTSYDTIRTGTSLYLTKPVKRYFLKAAAGINSEKVYPQTSDTFTSYDLNTLKVFVEIDQVSSILNPQDGYRTRLSVDRGGRIFGINLGGIDFTRFSLRHSQYLPITNDFIFAYRVFGGYYNKISTTETFETEKFSLGGANSLRGYRDFAFYGDYRFSINLEPRYQFNQSFIGVVFLDLGYISNTLSSQLSDSTYFGYGTGIRFLNSFLPLRFDFAYGNDFMIHFNVSQTF